MATALEKIQELRDKIDAAEKRIAALEFSIYNDNQPGQSFLTAAIRECNAVGKANCAEYIRNVIDCYKKPGGLAFTGISDDNCAQQFQIWGNPQLNSARSSAIIVAQRELEIADLKNKINGYNSQIAILQKDPTVIDFLADEANKRKLIWFIVAGVVIVGSAIFIWYKWIRK